MADTTIRLEFRDDGSSSTNSSSDLKDLFKGTGKGLIEALYQGVYEALQGQQNLFARMNDPVIGKARSAYEAGLINSPDDLRRLVNAGYDPALAGLTQPVAQPVGVPISAAEYAGVAGMERQVLDAGIASGQFVLQGPASSPTAQPVGGDARQGERETRAKESQDRLARKIARSLIDAEVPLAEAVDPLMTRKEGEAAARAKESQDARDRAHVLRHLEATIPEAEEVKPTGFGDTMAPLLMKAMGAGGAARLAGRFIDRRNRSKYANEKAEALHGAGKHEEANKVTAGEEATKAAEKIPVVGDVIDAVEVVSKTIQAGADAMRIGMKAQSDTVVELAGNNYMGAFNKQVEGAADTMRQIPIVGGALASGLELAVQPVRSFADVVSSFVERGKQLSMYSGELAGANAQADVRSIMSDIREAESLGPELAKLTDLESRAWADAKEIWLPIKEAICEILVDNMQVIVSTLDSLVTASQLANTINKGVLDQMVDMLSWNPQKAANDMANTLLAIQGILEGKKADPNALELLYGVLDGKPKAAPPANPFGAPIAPHFPIPGGG